jgi:hypothetical protein
VSLLVFVITLFSLPVLATVDTNYQENTPLILFDDNVNFWSVGGYGNGIVGASVAASTVTKETGNSSAQINLNTGHYYYVEVGHDFHATNDWSMYDRLCFWFYGSNSSNLIEVALAAPDSANQYMLTFTDDFSGWVHLVFPFETFLSMGNARLSTITEIGFFFFDAPQTFYVDHLILDTSQAQPTPTITPFITDLPSLTPTAPMLTPTPVVTAFPSLPPTTDALSTIPTANPNPQNPTTALNTPTLTTTPNTSPQTSSSPTQSALSILNPNDNAVSPGWVNWVSVVLVVALVVIVIVYVNRASKTAKTRLQQPKN